MSVSRRHVLQLSLAADDRGPEGDVLVTLFLRGGADGLNLVAPVAEKAYYRARPSLAIAAPDDLLANEAERAIELDSRFGLHPGLRPLYALYEQKELAIVHAVGSEDQTRSHFEAQDLMEHGSPVDQNLGSGWLGRHLRTRPGKRSPLSAVAISDTLPESLRGSPGASAVRNVDEFAIHGDEKERALFATALKHIYADSRDELGQAGRQVLETLDAVDRLRQETAENDASSAYPASRLADGLRQVARLIRAEVGLELACLDLNGWDTHFFQGATDGLFGGLATELAGALAAFHEDIRSYWDRVTVVAMTEFGRRVSENVSFGTDHGRGGVLFLLGGAVRGGRVVTNWPGLENDDLEPPGDLRVTIDYRDILAEIVRKRLHNEHVDEVFPGYTPRDYDLLEDSQILMREFLHDRDA